jgi:iron(III) transport system substrate-binding protein
METTMKNFLFKLALPAALMAAQIPSAFAADPSWGTYAAADRNAKLVEAARKEGTLTVYHVYPALTAVAAAFTKKYGIKVNAWRASSETVLQRLSTEARGNRFEADIVQNNAPENEAAYREKLLQEVRSPFQQDLVPQAVPAHREWAGIALDIWTAAYNTNKVKKEELPKTYQELADPKWKGRLGIEAGNHAWFGTLMSELGEEQGLKLFSNIIATNGMSVRKGHSLLTTLVASGEVPYALTVYSWNPEATKEKGAPIEAWAIAPVIAQPSTIAMTKKSPHPAAAVLFYDFLLSDGQKLLADAKFIPASKKIPHLYSNTPLKFIDPGKALDMQEQWIKQYDENVIKKAK